VNLPRLPISSVAMVSSRRSTRQGRPRPTVTGPEPFCDWRTLRVRVKLNGALSCLGAELLCRGTLSSQRAATGDGQVEARTDALTRQRTRLASERCASSTARRRRSLVRAIRPRASCTSRRAPCGSALSHAEREAVVAVLDARHSSVRGALRASRSGWPLRRQWPRARS
jgi:hypothetical protein